MITKVKKELKALRLSSEEVWVHRGLDQQWSKQGGKSESLYTEQEQSDVTDRRKKNICSYEIRV